jgi:hypothetical protein
LFDGSSLTCERPWLAPSAAACSHDGKAVEAEGKKEKSPYHPARLLYLRQCRLQGSVVLFGLISSPRRQGSALPLGMHEDWREQSGY